MYDTNQKDKGNLLLFSDSMGWPIDNLIADQFDKTFVINLRYDEFAGQNFNYNQFILQNNITDVMFLYEGISILFDEYDYNFAERIGG